MGYIHETRSSDRQERSDAFTQNAMFKDEFWALKKTCSSEGDVERLMELVKGINRAKWITPWCSSFELWVEIIDEDEEDGWVKGEQFMVVSCFRDEDNDLILECSNNEGSCTLCGDCYGELWKVL